MKIIFHEIIVKNPCVSALLRVIVNDYDDDNNNHCATRYHKTEIVCKMIDFRTVKIVYHLKAQLGVLFCSKQTESQTESYYTKCQVNKLKNVMICTKLHKCARCIKLFQVMFMHNIRCFR